MLLMKADPVGQRINWREAEEGLARMPPELMAQLRAYGVMADGKITPEGRRAIKHTVKSITESLLCVRAWISMLTVEKPKRARK
jgi:hypothetical protein